MELNCTAEKSETETIRLFLRRRGFLRDLRQCVAIMSVLCLAVSIFYWFGSAGSSCGLCQGVVYALLGTAVFLLCFFLVDRFLVQAPRRAYRQRVSHKIEYRLTDDALAFTVGETQFSSPWNKVAKKFRIDKKALYLYGKNLPFEAKCIPDWRGHGVEKKELVAALKKAGLKKVVPYGLNGLLFNGFVVVALMTYVYIGGRECGDWTIPNEDELRLVANEVPDGDNARLALLALTNICTVVCGHSQDDTSFVRNYSIAFAGNDSEVQAVRGDPASPKRAAKILADNAKFFENFHAALSRKGFFDKEKAAWDKKRDGNDAVEFPTNSCLQRFQCFVRFAQLAALKAQVSLENDDMDSAVSDINDIHTLGQLISTNGMSMVEYFVGGLIEKLSCEKMCDAIAMNTASDEVLEQFVRMVDLSEANALLCRERALKAEFAYHLKWIDWICNTLRKVDVNDAPRDAQQFVGRYKNMPDWLFRYFFRRCEMRYRMAAIFRTMIAGEEDPTKCSEWPQKDFWMGLRPNLAGNILLVSLMPCYSPIFKDRSWACIRPRLVLAAEKWRRAHGGENPPTLEALVPDYIAAVPRDPRSKKGAPMNYDASLGVAWSVGKDGKYDYREIAKDIPAAGNKASINGDTQKYAFRLDGKPIGFPIKAGHR